MAAEVCWTRRYYKSNSTGSIAPTLAKNARMGHPQLKCYSQNIGRGVGHPAKLPAFLCSHSFLQRLPVTISRTMPTELGPLALLVEGIVFFCVQEPETVAKTGILGEYISELFKGWAALVSGLSLILLFLPSSFPDKYRWCVWFGAASCFLIANFMVWNREHKARLEISRRLSRTVENRERMAELMHKGQLLEEGLSFCAMATDFVAWDQQEGDWKSSVSAYLYDLGYANYAAEFIRAGSEAQTVVGEPTVPVKKQRRINRIRLYHKVLENISARLS